MNKEFLVPNDEIERKKSLKTNKSVDDRIGENTSDVKLSVLEIKMVYREIEEQFLVMKYSDENEGRAVWKYLKDMARDKDRFHAYMDRLEGRVSGIEEQQKEKRETYLAELFEEVKGNVVNIFDKQRKEGESDEDVMAGVLEEMDKEKELANPESLEEIEVVQRAIRDYVGEILAEDFEFSVIEEDE